MRGLYAIVDTSACARARVDPEDLAESLLEAGVGAIQLRAKGEGAARVLELLRALAPCCARAGVPLFANDRPDLALIAGCDGVHVGQSDLAPRDVRQLADRCSSALRIGLSTHGAEELEGALGEPIDYVAIGPVFGTRSKADPEATVGLEVALSLAARARSRRPGLARVAIGGIDEQNAPRLAAAFDAIALISALLPEGEVGPSALVAARDRAERLRRAFSLPASIAEARS